MPLACRAFMPAVFTRYFCPIEFYATRRGAKKSPRWAGFKAQSEDRLSVRVR